MDFIGQGAGPIPVGTTGAGLASYPFEGFESATLDLTQITLGLEIIPARPGYFPYIFGALWIVESVSGVQTSPPTFQAGNDAAHTNTILPNSTTPSNANVNAANSVCAVTGPGLLNSGTVKKIPNATVFLDITAPAVGTGGFALKARLWVEVIWLAVSV